jgi:CheY-like chemotaxis protein
MMPADQTGSVLSAVASLIGVLVWPTVLIFVFLRLEPQLRKLINGDKDIQIKAAGFEASFTRPQLEAAAALGAASAQKSEAGNNEPATPAEVADTLARAIPDVQTRKKLGSSHVLWVDDRPDNNSYERAALEALGVSFDLSLSTDDALKKVQASPYDLIISDMGRPPDTQAGYTLLDSLRRSGNQTPFVIYAGSRQPALVALAREHGALGCTNVPAELISLVTGAIGRSGEGQRPSQV